jgi:hypothetical protein
MLLRKMRAPGAPQKSPPQGGASIEHFLEEI